MFRKFIAVLLIALALYPLTSCLAVKRVKDAVTEPDNAGFVPNMPGVLIPRNFIVDPSTASNFDSVEGKISEIKAEGFGEPETVEWFYDRKLPFYGWRRSEPLVYIKQNEVLLITITKEKTITHIKYQLRPNI